MFITKNMNSRYFYMRGTIKTGYNLVFIALLVFGCSPNGTERKGVVDFQKELPELLDTVQLTELFPDSKFFVDLPLKKTPDSIMSLFQVQKKEDDFDLRSFVFLNFDTTPASYKVYITNPHYTITEHIDTLWNILSRYPDSPKLSSLIPLKYPYIVPGGRFREIYYWDSYFTMLGLAESDQSYMIKYMIDNFTDLINTYGHIPNGNRTYYLSRSQPPFYASMVELLASIDNSVQLMDYLQSLVKEYNFWMYGKEKLSSEHPALYHTVWIDDSTILNRYWDNLSLPRPESYKEDVSLFNSSGRDSSIFRDIRAAAESGWDFSSRWFEDRYSLNTINTTQIVPVDLNCLLYNLENVISHAYREAGDVTKADKFQKIAEKRKRAINRLLWDPENGFYYDYNFKKKMQTDILSLAALYSLFYELADSLQALQVEEKLGKEFLFDYGVVTTLTQPSTHEQWDYPNGWAPLQWICFSGLMNYDYSNLAMEIAKKWMRINELIFYGEGDPEQKGKMLEKYNVVEGVSGKGGEYPLQDGFGWTNGVYIKFSTVESR